MPYRRTENVVRRLAEREQTILQAATEMAAEGGMAAVQIADVAKRAGIAAGTVYRYFPSKTDLVAELVAAVAGRELDAMRLDYRQSLALELETRIRAATERKLLPDQDARVAAPAIVGALMEGLLGPLAPTYDGDAGAREAVQGATLLALRALGVGDARARGLVMQCVLPNNKI